MPYRVALFVLVTFLLFCGGRLFAQDTVLLKVLLNTVDRGEHYLKLSDDGDVLLTPAKLLELGIHLPGKPKTDEAGYVSVKSLSPRITFTLLEQDAAVALTVDPALLDVQVKDMALKRRQGVLSSRTNSVFLNYALDYVGQQKYVALSLELAGRIGPVLFLSDANARLGVGSELTRNFSSIVFDDTATLFRGTVGDFVATSGGLGLGASGIYGGVSLTKNFSLDPYYLKGPNLSVSDLLSTPSTAQMLLNGTRAGEEMKFGSGGMQLINLPLPPGANTVELQITDADNQVRSIQIPFYVSARLLAPGVDQYSYSAGFARQALGEQSFSYGSPALLAFHNVGITPWLTAGGRAEASATVANAGPMAIMTLGLLGELDVSAALSYSRGVIGYGGAAEYGYQGRMFGGGVSVRYQSSDYTTVVSAPSGETPMIVGSAAVGIRQKLLGSLSAGASCSLLWNGTWQGLIALSYSRQLWDSMDLLAILGAQLQAGQAQLSGFVGLRLLIGDSLASLTDTLNTGANAISTGIQRSVSRGNGFGYDVNLTESNDAQNASTLLFDGNAELNYHGPFGIYSAAAAYSQEQSQLSYELDMQGSMVIIDNTFHLAQPILDSFALVRVNGLKGVRVTYSTQDVGVTDAAGTALVTGLSSYADNQLGIEQADIPMDYTIDAYMRSISPAYRGGGVVDFNPRRFKALSGTLFFVTGEKRAPAQYAGLDVSVGGAVVSSVTGTGGEFYLENIPTGTYVARVYTQERESTFNLVVPDSKDIVEDLGEIDCPVK